MMSPKSIKIPFLLYKSVQGKKPSVVHPTQENSSHFLIFLVPIKPLIALT